MNAEKSVNECRFDTLGQPQTGAAIDLITGIFRRHEPLALTVGQTHDEFKAMLDVFLPAALPDGLTMGAFDLDRLVGIALTTPFTFTPPPEIEGTSPTYPPIGALIEALEHGYEHQNAGRLDRCAHINMLAIDDTMRGRGIGQALVNATTQNARAKGFDAVLSDATNPTSQWVFANLGFETRNEIRYDTFDHGGARTFASIANLGAIKLVEKRL